MSASCYLGQVSGAQTWPARGCGQQGDLTSKEIWPTRGFGQQAIKISDQAPLITKPTDRLFATNDESHNSMFITWLLVASNLFVVFIIAGKVKNPCLQLIRYIGFRKATVVFLKENFYPKNYSNYSQSAIVLL